MKQYDYSRGEDQYVALVKTNDPRIQYLNGVAKFDRVTIASATENVLFVGIKIIHATNRANALRKAFNWYQNHLRHLSLGPSRHVLSVSDPKGEVFYRPDLKCSSSQMYFLDDETANRLIKESNGKLAARKPVAGYSYWQLYKTRRKRKRSMHKVAPCILRGGSGVLYYRVTIKPNVSRGGVVISKRVVKNVPLKHREIKAALQEVIERNLRALHKTGRSRMFRARMYEEFLSKTST